MAEPIAIVGMSCRFPGADGVDAYWRNILGKVDAISDPPPEAWDTDVYYDPSFADTDKTYCKRGGYLGSLVTFDPLEHGIPPVTVGGEPDQWLALQVAKEALADAGAETLPDAVRARTGIVLGKGTYLNGGNAIAVQRGLIIDQTLDVLRKLHPEHSERELDRLREECKRALPPLGPETVPGLIPNIIVGRIANRLDLMGPTYTVDAACASSLVAIELAMRDLHDGTCDLALAGGSQVWMPVPTLNVFCRLGALSRREQIRPFDKDADGTLLGEGIGMIVLKRLSDARRDGDRVYAAIRGVGVASDGRGTSVMAPRTDGEVLALRRAYDRAEVAPASVALVEAHGTGTAVGDVVEVEALTEVFGTRDGGLPGCALGTVKSMISHTIPASGVAGVIKLALALHHCVLPPTLHCDEPNPKLGLERTPFYINTETRPWIHGGPEPRRAGVNAFGFGGINAHAVLEEVSGTGVPAHLPPWDSEVCILEGESAAALAGQARTLAAALDPEPAGFGLTDLAFTLSRRLRRDEAALRLAVVATSLADLRAKLERAAERLAKPDCRRIKGVSGIYFAAAPLGRDGKVVHVFPGEGAQYPGMLADLCLHFGEVREAFDQVDRIYAGHPRGHLSSDWIFPRPTFSADERRLAEERLMQMDIAVESVLTGNAAVHALLRRLGVRADAYLGHSTGEFSAAHAAGVLQLDAEDERAAFSEALYACYSDAASRDDLPKAVLLAVGADGEQVAAIAREAGGELTVAMDNCPHQAVLVGEPEAAERARTIIQREGLIHEQLPYDRAVHTPRFAPFADALRDVFARTGIAAPSTPLYSCTTTERYPDEPERIRALLVEHWVSPVAFRQTIEALHDDGARVFVESGPRGNMSAFIEDILRGREFCAVPADVQRRSGITQLNHLVAMLAVHAVELDATQLFAGRGAREVAWEDPAARAAPAARTHVELATRWPMLRLSDAAVAGVRGTAARDNTAHPGTPGNGANGAPHTDEAREAAPHTDEAGNGLPVLSGPVFAAAPAIPPAPAPEADAVMDAHLQTMQQFLAAQQQIMQAFLAPPEPALHPLLGDVVAFTAGTELITRRRVDPEQDRYLDDHRLGGALAVMPLTMTLALLAEAAAQLAPGLHVTGLRDVRAHRWLSFGDDVPTVQLSARRLHGDDTEPRVRVELRNLTEDPAPATPVVEATVVLAAAHPTAPPPLPPLHGAQPSRWAPEELYDAAMFHGPRWQGVRAVEATAPGGASARLQAMSLDGFLADRPMPPLALDPVVLDAAGQLIGFWTAERLERGKVVFPFRLAALDVYGPPRPAGEALGCAARIELVGDQLVRSDIEVRAADGGQWMRLSGWEDKRFDVPPAFLPLVHGAGELSSTWAAPLAGPADGRPLACRRLAAQLPADGGPWTGVWAQRVLGPAERAQLRALRAPERRRLEWLAARTAAKEAVAELVLVHHGVALEPVEIEILPDAQGRPLVSGPRLAGLEPAPVVSLAHTDGRAVALAALGGRVGIDIERLRPRPPGFAAAAFSPQELDLLAAVPAAAAEEWELRCWCAKEAVAKALGTGLVRGPRETVIVAIDRERERIEVRREGETLLAHCGRENDMIVATTLCARGGSAG